MIYGTIISQSSKKVVSTKQMTRMWIKEDKEKGVFKIKASTPDKKKITLAKYKNRYACDVVFRYAYLFWGKDIYNGDAEFDKMKGMLDHDHPFSRALFGESETRFYMPDESSAETIFYELRPDLEPERLTYKPLNYTNPKFEDIQLFDDVLEPCSDDEELDGLLKRLQKEDSYAAKTHSFAK